MEMWQWKKIELSKFGHQFTHARQGWPFARTLKRRLRAQSVNTVYVSKQEAVRRAGLQKGKCVRYPNEYSSTAPKLCVKRLAGESAQRLRAKIDQVPAYERIN